MRAALLGQDGEWMQVLKRVHSEFEAREYLLRKARIGITDPAVLADRENFIRNELKLPKKDWIFLQDGPAAQDPDRPWGPPKGDKLDTRSDVDKRIEAIALAAKNLIFEQSGNAKLARGPALERDSRSKQPFAVTAVAPRVCLAPGTP